MATMRNPARMMRTWSHRFPIRAAVALMALLSALAYLSFSLPPGPISSWLSRASLAGNAHEIVLDLNNLWAQNFNETGPDGIVEDGWDWVRELQTTSHQNELARERLRLSRSDKVVLAGRIEALMEELQRNFPVDQWREARNDTLDALTTLHDCLAGNYCTNSQLTVVVGAAKNFGNSLYGKVSGEDIWARSSIDSFLELGYTVLYAYDTLETLAIHTAIPGLVAIIIAEGVQVKECAGLGWPHLLDERDLRENLGAVVLSEEELRTVRHRLNIAVEGDGSIKPGETWGWRKPRGSNKIDQSGCAKRIGFEQGIPVWKMFSWHFWGGPDHPLGRAWTLSPEPLEGNKQSKNFYLGYSIEKYCTRFGVVPRAQREHRAMILAKNFDYLDKSHFKFWNNDHTFKDLKQKLKVDFVATAGNPDNKFDDPGLTNIGRRPIEEFYQELGKSKALIGLGNPWLSPTPYDALCLGVPFVMPVNDFDERNPTNRDRWNCQHNGLVDVLPPNVYIVMSHDLEGYEKAIRSAIENPIDSYILPRMTSDSNRQRHYELAEMDWHRMAERRLAAMRAAGEDTPLLA